MPKISLDGLSIDCEVHGDGKPVVLLHGFCYSKNTWQNQVSAFSGRYRVIVMSHRGHGESDKPPGEENYAIPVFAGDVRRLLEKLEINEKIVLVGHSMGGKIAQQYCLDYPEQVRAAVFCSTLTGPVPAGTFTGPSLGNRAQAIEAKGMTAFLDDFAPLWFAPGTDAGFIRSATADCYKVPGHVAIAMSKSARTLDLADRLPEINLPVLVIVGGADQRTPVAESEKINRLLPNSWLRIIPGAGHMAHVEKPGPFNSSVLDFLKIIS